VQQDYQHPVADGGVRLQRFVGRNGNLLLRSPALPAELRFPHPELAVSQAYPSSLAPMPDDVPLARLAPLRFAGHLASRQPDHGLDAGMAQHVDQIFDGDSALFDQFHYRQQELPMAGQQVG